MNPSSDPHVSETADRLARRPWLATPLRARPDLSFEFFPPSSRAGWDQLCRSFETLAPFSPSFASVTYGAGGSTRLTTRRTIETLHAAYDVDIAGHVTGAASAKADVHRVLDQYAEVGVRRVVALRGDAPQTVEGPLPTGYESAEDLVRAIRARPDSGAWEISVAGYPETHPRAASRAADIESLRRKVEAGADRIITQFFYDNDDFFRFADDVRRAGIDLPIAAGIMPVHNFASVSRFAHRCGAAIPDWMRELFDPIDDPSIRRLVAATIAAEQCRGLVEWGVQHLHFYTLNQADLTEAVLRMLGYHEAKADIVTIDGATRAG